LDQWIGVLLGWWYQVFEIFFGGFFGSEHEHEFAFVLGTLHTLGLQPVGEVF